MKREIFTTRLRAYAYRFSLSTLLILLLSNMSVAQDDCPLVANDLVQVSMNEVCDVEITPDMILEGVVDVDDCDYEVVVLGTNNQPLPTSPNVTSVNVGQTLTVEVYLDGNKTWGLIKIEDKFAPTIECPTDEEVFCFQGDDLPLPTYSDNCGTAELITLSDETEDLDCEEEYSARRTIQYQAVDNSGNRSEVCTRVINYIRIEQGDVLYPGHYDGVDVDEDGNYTGNDDVVHYAALPCDNSPVWDTNNNGYPDISETGAPYYDLDGEFYPLYPSAGYCELNITVDDKKIDICEGSFKVLRTWEVLYWCTGSIEKMHQVIKVIDDKGPVVECAEDKVYEVDANAYDCEGTWTSVDPVVIADCGSTSYTVSYQHADAYGAYDDAGIFTNENVAKAGSKYTISKLPLGITRVKYSVKDDCGNVTECFTTLRVVDNYAPNAVCKEFTVAALTTDGTARVYAPSFDDESYDNCKLKTMLVRRMDAGDCECEVPEFDHLDYVGNVGGKYIYNSKHDFIYRYANRHVNALGGSLLDTTGMSVTDQKWLNENLFDDNDLYTFWSAETSEELYKDDFKSEHKYLVSFDNTCGFSTHVKFCCSDIANDENMVVFRVVDYYGNYNDCMVNVRVEDKLNPYIYCPEDIELTCGSDILDLDVTGRPEYGDNCENPTMEWKDSGELSQCGTGTIRRTFTVTDAGGRTASCTQSITVYDNDPFDYDDITWPANVTKNGCMVGDTDPGHTGKPTFNDDECSLVASTYEDKVFNFADGACFKILRTWTVIDWCTYNEQEYYLGDHSGYWEYVQIIKVNNTIDPEFDSCEDYKVGIYGSDCTGAVTFTQNATDDCTAAEDLNYHYQIDLNGDKVIDSNDKTGHSKSFTLDLEPGVYTVYWKVEDQCGNVARCEQEVTVEDKKKPTPYCLGDIRTVIMPSTGEIDIWASDFDLGSYDNCSEVKVSFSETNVNDTQRVFNCGNIGENEVNVYVHDAAGNVNFCTVTIHIQPGDSGCGEGIVAGNISTPEARPVKDVSVRLQNMSSSETMQYATTATGNYQFLSVNGTNGFRLVPEKDDEHKNGVNTRDLIAVQRHLLNIVKLNSPYAIIAADANNDKRVNPQDLLEMRKVILKLNDRFTNNTSWRFVDKNHTFADNNRPFDFEEEIMVNEVNQASSNEDFVAIKVGDVMESAKLGLKDDAVDVRSNEVFTMSYKPANHGAYEVVEVPVFANSASLLTGLQYELDAAGYIVRDIVAGELAVSEEHFNATQNTVAVSWSDAKGVRVDADAMLFKLILESTTEGNTMGKLNFISTDIAAEAYNENLDIYNLELSTRSDAGSSFIVGQNTPNPFYGSTMVSVQVPTAGDVKIEVFDVNGKMLFSQSSYYSVGQHKIMLEADALRTEGVMYYTVTTGNQQITKKMIAIKK